MSRYVYLVSITSKDGNELKQSTYVFTNKRDAQHKFAMIKVEKFVDSSRKSVRIGRIYAQELNDDNSYCHRLEKDFNSEYTYLTFKKVKLGKGENVVEYTETFAFKKGEENEKEDK